MAADGTLSLLCRLLPMLRAAFPATRLQSSGSTGNTPRKTPEILDFLDASNLRLDYVEYAMRKNAVLQRHAESAMAVARASERGRGEYPAEPSTSIPTPATRPARGAANAGS